jgi:large subunit ribosomal protein L7/L12
MQDFYQSFFVCDRSWSVKKVDTMNSRLSKLASLQQRAASLDSKIADLKRAAADAARRDDARRKVLVGAAVLDAIESKRIPPDSFVRLLDRFLTRPGDRVVFTSGPIVLPTVPQQPASPVSPPSE